MLSKCGLKILKATEESQGRGPKDGKDWVTWDVADHGRVLNLILNQFQCDPAEAGSGQPG